MWYFFIPRCYIFSACTLDHPLYSTITRKLTDFDVSWPYLLYKRNKFISAISSLLRIYQRIINFKRWLSLFFLFSFFESFNEKAIWSLGKTIFCAVFTSQSSRFKRIFLRECSGKKIEVYGGQWKFKLEMSKSNYFGSIVVEIRYKYCFYVNENNINTRKRL